MSARAKRAAPKPKPKPKAAAKSPARRPAAKRTPAAAKPKAAAKPRAKRPAAKPAPSQIDLAKLGGRVLGLCGAFASKTVVVMPTELADTMFPDGLGVSGRQDPVTAVEKDIAAIRERDEELADSGLAATALAMAYELVNPFNSATAKSMCAGRLADALKELRALSPPTAKADRIDEVNKKREQRKSRAHRGAEA